VFTVKAALPEEDMTVGEMFRGAIPYWIALLVVTVCVAVFPQTATWLPSLAF
jgi:C4-dicarboxylate transporter DctM subunit